MSALVVPGNREWNDVSHGTPPPSLLFFMSHLDDCGSRRAIPVHWWCQTQLTVQTIHGAPSLTSPGSHCHLPTGNPQPRCWLLTSNFKFRSRRSALLGESHLHVCRLLCVHTQQPALCARLQSATHCSSSAPPPQPRRRLPRFDS